METTILTVNNVWMMVCTALVFFMHWDSLFEIGLTRQKNTINILFKNFFVITMGLYCIVLVDLTLCILDLKMEKLVYSNSQVLEYLLQREEWNLDTLTVVTPGGPIFFSKVCLPPLQRQLFQEQLLSESNYLDLCYLQFYTLE